MTERFVPPHGGYRDILSYKKSLIVYDATIRFCKRFVSKRDRTYDQMVQAARSGKQNIIEGSLASATSKKTEIRLTSVARASFEELLEEWTQNHRYTKRLRELNRIPDANYETFRKAIEHENPAIAANVIIGLIKVTTYLLDRQTRQLEKEFVEEGGLSEHMTRARLRERGRNGRK